MSFEKVANWFKPANHTDSAKFVSGCKIIVASVVALATMPYCMIPLCAWMIGDMISEGTERWFRSEP